MTASGDAAPAARLDRARPHVRGLSLLTGAAAALLGLAGVTVPAPAVASAAPGAAAKVSSSGTVRGWGYNSYGQLGDGTEDFHGTPVKLRLPSGVKVTSVRVGCYHSLALTTAGRVLAAGRNSAGQLGNGSTTNHVSPVYVKLPAGSKVTAVRAGCEFSLALTAGGQVLAWGDNLYGQLGDGTTTSTGTPAKVHISVPGTGHVTALFAGCYHSLAQTSTGKVLAWGRNAEGQLGDGTITDSHTAVKVRLPTGTTVTAVSAGCLHSLALTASGKVLAWGDNTAGQLGNDSTNGSDVPVRAHLATSLVATAIGSGPVSESSFAIVHAT
jgi:alpha-tubulin suppressor-like RCC1 family protein